MRSIPEIPEEDSNDYADRDFQRGKPRSAKKGIMILGGAAVGLALAFYFSQASREQAPSSVNAPPVQVKSVPTQPDIDKGKDAASSAPASAPASAPEEMDPSRVDQRLAALSKENVIEEDLSATAKKPSKPEPVQSAPKVSAPVKAAPAEPQAGAAMEQPAQDAPDEGMDEIKRAKAPAGEIKNDRPPQAKAPASGRTYSVQVVSTTDALKALDIRDKLASSGFSPWIATNASKEDSYRVEVGVYGSIKEAAPVSARLSDAGFANRAAYLAGGKLVTLVAGVFTAQDEARGLERRIRSAGFDAKIKLRSDSKSLYMVRVGKFNSEQEARETMVAIRKSGFHPMGIDD